LRATLDAAPDADSPDVAETTRLVRVPAPCQRNDSGRADTVGGMTPGVRTRQIVTERQKL
jgi:hypothetical protein